MLPGGSIQGAPSGAPSPDPLGVYVFSYIYIYIFFIILRLVITLRQKGDEYEVYVWNPRSPIRSAAFHLTAEVPFHFVGTKGSLFVCGISLMSGQLISELFPDCTRSCFLQVVLRRRGGDRIYEMRCPFVAVGLSANRESNPQNLLVSAGSPLSPPFMISRGH